MNPDKILWVMCQAKYDFFFFFALSLSVAFYSLSRCVPRPRSDLDERLTKFVDMVQRRC